MTSPRTARTTAARTTALRTGTALVLAAALAACGGSGDQVVGSAPSVATSTATTGATPSTAASTPVCPITAKEVPALPSASKDLKTKPVVTGSRTAPPTEVQYFDVVKGAGDQAVTGSQVKVKYVGAFYATGKEFDSSWSRGPEETLPFGICQQGVIPGFAVGPSGMKVGGRRQIIIPAPFGYGAKGQPPTIPANSALVFVVDLVSVG